MKAHELRDLSTAELEARLKDEESALQNMHFTKSVTGQLENPARIKTHRREIARLKTILNEKLSAEQA
ncbi:MAG: 50S ribosomal protein L29 [Balneolaceae bacterium]|nr:50S ribosomal protein L29 [Balneolaceae bacterium]